MPGSIRIARFWNLNTQCQCVVFIFSSDSCVSMKCTSRVIGRGGGKPVKRKTYSIQFRTQHLKLRISSKGYFCTVMLPTLIFLVCIIIIINIIYLHICKHNSKSVQNSANTRNRTLMNWMLLWSCTYFSVTALHIESIIIARNIRYPWVK